MLWRPSLVNRSSKILKRNPDRWAQAQGDHAGPLLSTLGEILPEQDDREEVVVVLREVLAICNAQFGPVHPVTLAARGDLAVILFGLGETSEAARQESEALADARIQFGSHHPVTCVLAWNRALRLESVGDKDSARRIVVDD